MSYTETVGKIGEYETLSVVSESGSAFTIIPALGARLNSFLVPTKAGPVEVIDGYQDDKELAVEYYSKSSLLAPFPNRIATDASPLPVSASSFPSISPLSIMQSMASSQISSLLSSREEKLPLPIK